MVAILGKYSAILPYKVGDESSVKREKSAFQLRARIWLFFFGTAELGLPTTEWTRMSSYSDGLHIASILKGMYSGPSI